MFEARPVTDIPGGRFLKGWKIMYRLSQFVNDNQARQIVVGPCALTAVLVHSPAVTDLIILYDGLDATSGLRMGDFASPTASPFQFHFDTPVLFNRGLFVAISGTPTDYTICYLPLANDPPDPGRMVSLKDLMDAMGY